MAKFEWNAANAAVNIAKHGISFDLAIGVFDDPFALLMPDVGHSTHETREWIIGESDDHVLVVVFTRRTSGGIFRLISARRAKKREREAYEESKRVRFF